MAPVSRAAATTIGLRVGARSDGPRAREVEGATAHAACVGEDLAGGGVENEDHGGFCRPLPRDRSERVLGSDLRAGVGRITGERRDNRAGARHR